MDSSKARRLINAIDLGQRKQAANGPPSKTYTRLMKINKQSDKRKRFLRQNKTIQFFRDISSRSLRSKTVEKSSELESSGNSEYMPYSREKLYERIATFQKLQNWSVTHYDDFNPLTIALHGWKCDVRKTNEILCGSCGGHMLIKLSDVKNDEDAEDDEEAATFNEELETAVNKKLIGVYLEKLVTEHHGSCPWKKQWTPSNIYEIRFENFNEELTLFKSSYQENLKFSRDLSLYQFKHVLEPEALLTIQRWCEVENIEFDGTIVEITILGWEVMKLIQDRIMLCSKSDARRVLLSEEEEIDLVGEHHSWSSYVKGYEVLLRIFEVVVDQYNSVVFSEENDDGVELGEHEGNLSIGSIDDTLNRLNKLRKDIL